MSMLSRNRTTGLWRRLPPSALVSLTLLLTAACLPSAEERGPRLVMFVGIDVSGSFQRTGNYDDAMRFAAHYIYGHLNALGELEPPAALFVGSIGGERPGEAKSFHPIHDFREKGVDEIEASLREWFPPDDQFTDFNAFFRRVSTLVKRQNLILRPLNIVVISDGVPDVTAAQPASAGEDAGPYESIDLEPLEFLSRNATVRLLYADPPVAARWERDVPRDRVRIWTQDAEVMVGWREQITPNAPLEQQDRLWQWMAENVDFRVRSQIL